MPIDSSLDYQVVSLAQAIRQHESQNNFNAKGKSGESGAYQWLPESWKSDAQEVLGNANAEMTPDNQNAVAYVKIKKWKDSGLNPAQIAAKWNSGSETDWENKVGTNAEGAKYDVPSYVKSVTDLYQQMKAQNEAPLTNQVQAATEGAQPAQPIAPQLPTDTNAQNASFPSTGQESPLGIAGNVVGNIPSSGYNFVKNTAQFFNPVKNLQNVGEYFKSALDTSQPQVGAGAILKEMPHEAYKALVPQFIQHIFTGDLSKASQTLQNDPVGQILPLLMVGRGLAKTAGVEAQFDSAISKVASPVTKPISAVAGKVAETAGTVSSQVLGAATGAGASSIKSAFEHTQAFTDALRGKINPDEVVQTAQDAVQKIADTRRAEYVSALKDIGEQKGSLDISPIQETLDTQLKNFNIKETKEGLDFSRSSIANNGSARADVQGVYDTLKEWGSQTGDRTPLGLDTLKKQLGDFYSESGSARALVQAVKSNVDGILKTNVDGYSNMTNKYANTSALLDDIKSATGVGGRAKVDTVFTKLTTAMKADKELRLEILKQMQAEGAQPDLMAKIAGINMQSYIPKGLVGKGVDIAGAFATVGHYFNPSFLPMLLSTSPRIVGEFVRALGMGAEKTTTVLNAINHITEQIPPQVSNYLNNPKLGLSIEDVSKNVPAADRQIMVKFIDHAADPKGTPMTDSEFSSAETIAKGMGISMDDGLSKVASQFRNIIEGGKHFPSEERVLGTNPEGNLNGDVGSVAGKSLGATEALRTASGLNRQGMKYQDIVQTLIKEGATKQVAENAAAPYSI